MKDHASVLQLTHTDCLLHNEGVKRIENGKHIRPESYLVIGILLTAITSFAFALTFIFDFADTARGVNEAVSNLLGVLFLFFILTAGVVYGIQSTWKVFRDLNASLVSTSAIVSNAGWSYWTSSYRLLLENDEAFAVSAEIADKVRPGSG